MPHTVPDLPYDYDALEPHIDERTMRLHHDAHHGAYVRALNRALETRPELADARVETLLRRIDEVPESIRSAVRNHGGGHANHSLFWRIMSAEGGGAPSGSLLDAIIESFGSFLAFKEQFTERAARQFGSGWAWLAVSDDGLELMATPNQDSPLMRERTPILGIDVWEHAYYLEYHDRRPDYIEAWWHVVNWSEVGLLFEETRKT